MLTFLSFFWDPDPVFWKIPGLNLPILWYGLLFAFGFALSFPLFVKLLKEYVGKEKAVFLTDRLVLYIVFATVIGARVGHFIFYEKPSSYLLKPWELFLPPYAGLASHGAAIAIPIAVYLFAKRYRKYLGSIHALKLIDLLCIPTALVATFIRIGNFINQEILGSFTDLPWAVVFGHPADHSPIGPRHPVQLYEAIFYLLVFIVLFTLQKRLKNSLKDGFLLGLFLILVFGFRFVVEYWKLEQSQWMPHNFIFTMGQLLSIPAIILGFICVLRKDRS